MDGRKLILSDFGLAEIIGEEIPRGNGRIDGDRNFLSVDVSNGNDPSKKSDLVALGYMGVYLFEHQLPWSSSTTLPKEKAAFYVYQEKKRFNEKVVSSCDPCLW